MHTPTMRPIIGRAAALLPIAGLFILTTACGSDETNGDGNNDNNSMMMEDMGQDMPEEDMPKQDMPEDMPKQDMPEEDMRPEEDMKPPAPEPGPRMDPRSFSVYPPVPVSCDEPNKRYRIPYASVALEAGRNDLPPRMLQPYDRIGARLLIPSDTVDVGAVDVDRTRISEEGSDACETSTDCSTGFVCAAAGPREATKACVRKTGINFIPGTTTFDVDPGTGDKNQLITILIDNGGRLQGFLENEVACGYDEQGNQHPACPSNLTAPNKQQVLSSIATDVDLSVRGFIEDFMLDVASFASSNTSRLGVLWYNSSRATAITNADDFRDHYVTDLEAATGRVDALPQPNGIQGDLSNTYKAIDQVISQDLALEKYDDHEKFLFLITDGPNDVWNPDNTYADVLQRLQDAGVRVYIIHYDTPVDATNLRDPWAYWAGDSTCRDDIGCETAPGCQDDSDCASYEECRRATIYAQDEMSMPTQSDLPYCLPKYRPDGRLGPVDEFADLACRTGGNYLYLPTARSVEAPLGALAGVIDGQWSIEADISYLNTDRVPEGFYKLSGIFLGLFGNSSIGDRLTSTITIPDPNDPMQTRILTPDNRPLVRLGAPKLSRKSNPDE